MASTEERIQATIHSLEMGRLAVWVRRVVAVLAAVALACLYLFNEFRGFGAREAMEQGQIARSIASGEGWKTKVLRPLALGELRREGRPLGEAMWRDTFHAPLPPLVNALPVLAVKGGWKLTPREPVYAPELAIAAMSMLLFFGALAFQFHLARTLFDGTVAWISCGLVLVCEAMWRYSVSGLPQMLMLFLLNGTLWALVGAIRARALGGHAVAWTAAAGCGFGLLALSHALTVCVFVPAAIFFAVVCRKRPVLPVVLVLVFLAVWVPWLARNQAVCGDWRGIARLALLDGVGGSLAGHLRQFEIGSLFAPEAIAARMKSNFIGQFDRGFEQIGWSLATLFGFASLLHRFRRPATASARVLILLMWAGAVGGMSLVGVPTDFGVSANQLHLLFVPAWSCYGVAFLLVLWNRRIGYSAAFAASSESVRRWAGWAMLAVLFAASAMPLILRSPWKLNFQKLQWPPYLPHYISVLGDWTEPGEIIATDMPWAVAWYADRPALWLPRTIREFTDLSDYQVLGGPLTALYLTPVSGSMNSIGDLVGGEYAGWTPLILRQFDRVPANFPLKRAVLLGRPECVFMSDRERRKRVQ
jgi:hypothetical protein